MSFIYSPTSVSATGLAANLANLLGHVTASPSGLLPVAPTGTDGYLIAICDALIGGMGYQDSNDAFAVGNFTSTASGVSPLWEDVGNGTTTGFSPWTFTVPVTRKYVIEVTASYNFISSTGNSTHLFRLVIDGVAQATMASAASWGNDSGRRAVFSVPAVLTAGSHTVKLQWQVSTGMTASVTTSSEGRSFLVWA